MSLAALDVTIVNSPSKSRNLSCAIFGIGMVPGLASDLLGLYHMGGFFGMVIYHVSKLGISSSVGVGEENLPWLPGRDWSSLTLYKQWGSLVPPEQVSLNDHELLEGSKTDLLDSFQTSRYIVTL